MRILLSGLLLALISCNNGANANTGQTPDPPDPPVDHQPAYTAYFDGDRAWDYLVDQVDLGFRVPGTTAHRACKNYLVDELKKYCASVETQAFTRKLKGEDVQMWNIIGRIKPEADHRIILGAHWDTRPTADYNPPDSRNQPIAGANDGASGVAVVLELARVFSEHEPSVGIDVVLFDGEDYGPGIDNMFLGSRYFADELTSEQIRAYNYGILLDMVGDRDLAIKPETKGQAYAQLVYTAAYEVCGKLGYKVLKPTGAIEIYDDHVFLLAVGVRMYDFIDFDYPHWHTTNDTVDKCSAESLETIGRIVENTVYLHPNLYAQ